MDETTDTFRFPTVRHIQKDFIDDLKASAILDAYICQHVLGWQVTISNPDPHYGGEISPHSDCRNRDGNLRRVAKVSQTLSASYRVIEALEERGRKVTLKYSGKRWYAWVRSEPPAKADADSTSLPLALGRAALKDYLGRDYIEREVWQTIDRVMDNKVRTQSHRERKLDDADRRLLTSVQKLKAMKGKK